MQKFIAKYSLAAHLAIVVVAPLALLPFCEVDAIAKVSLWLTLLAAVWTFMEPSLRAGESLHIARSRAAYHISRDVLFWLMLLVSIVALVRHLNGGVRMAYAPETQTWSLAAPDMSLMPGSVTGAAFLPFTAVLGLTVVLAAVRHSLGLSARAAFFFAVSLLSGGAAILMLYFKYPATPSSGMLHSYAGATFGVALLIGVATVPAAFRRAWRAMIPLFIVGIGGSAAGMFYYAPTYHFAIFAILAIILIAYVFLEAKFTLPDTDCFKVMVVIGISLAAGAMAIWSVMDKPAILARFDELIDQRFLTEAFHNARNALAGVSMRSWLDQLWLGTGIGSFSFDIRFHALAADRQVIPYGLADAGNGYWQLLSERGLVGAVMIALPLGMLVWSYLTGAVRCVRMRRLPHPMTLVAPMAVAAIAVASLYDLSILRPDVLLAVGAALAVSAQSFPREN